MTAVAEALPLVITEPGVYDGIPDETYHADCVPGGSLSSTGARWLTPPSVPAKFKWLRENRVYKRSFDLGHAAHSLVLGAGMSFQIIDAPDYTTRAAQQQRREAREAGLVPLLTGEHEQVQGMAEALRAHPVAGALLDPESGKPEQSLFWQDEHAGIWRRCRLDWLRHRSSGRLLVPDYKTTKNAEPESVAKDIANYGYHQQAAWYLDAVKALGLADKAAFLLIFQERAEPYLVNVVEPDDFAVRIGRYLNRAAIDLYARCVADDVWPGYPNDPQLVSLPGWVERLYEGVL